MIKRFGINVHSVVYGSLALIHVFAAVHGGGEVLAALCDGAGAIGYGVLGWWHGGGGPATTAASHDGAGGGAR